jgi:hypothetical protein
MLKRLWLDDCGALIATEWVFAAVLLVLGVVAGLSGVRSAVNSQLMSVGDAILSVDPAYEMSGQHNAESGTAGSTHIENRIEIHGPLTGPKQRDKSAVVIDDLPCD